MIKFRSNITRQDQELVRIRMTVSVDPELVKFLDQCIERGYFADRSHGVRFALIMLKKMMEKGEIVFKL